MQPKLGSKIARAGHLPESSPGVDDYNDLTYSTLPAPATTLTQQQCHHDSDSTSRAAVLRHRKDFPHALVYGPIEYQGLGIPNLYTSQGISISNGF
jgi:hypothetical protein